MRGGSRGRLRLEVSLHVHATEDEEGVRRSLERILGIRRDEVERVQLTGHHGNPVVVLSATLMDERALDVLRSVLRGMDAAERDIVRRSLEEMSDERGRIYIRLDKQGLVLGRIRMGREDPVRIVLSSGSGRAEAAELVLGMLDEVSRE
ncbi:MAG: RNA-binding domain-containing protein [Conexivisphaera sp.]